MRKIHRLKTFEEAIEEGAKPELGNSVEVIERLHPAQINRTKVGIIVKGPGKIAPLGSQGVYCCVSSFPGLLADLHGQVNKRWDSDAYRRQLPNRRQHFPVHMLLGSSWPRRDTKRFFDRRRIVHFSAFDYRRDVVDVANVF